MSYDTPTSTPHYAPPSPRRRGSIVLEEDPMDMVFIRDRNGLQRICRSCIRTVRADGNYVELHTGDRRFVLRTSLCDAIMQLGEHRFRQVNRNTAVNLARLERVDLDSVEVDGNVITLSRNYRPALLEHLRVLGGR